MQKPRSFKYLVDKYGQRRGDSVDSAYTQEELVDRFVVFDAAVKEYLVFRNVAAYVKYTDTLPQAKRTFHEVIFGWKAQKVKIDVDVRPSI